jgi:cytoskeletal protein CcmA (bactofilin family)
MRSPSEPAGSGLDPVDRLGPFSHELARDVVITGKLHFPSSVVIDGQLSGEVRADDLLVIGPDALVRAEVRARRLVLFGRLEGSVQESERIELRRGAVLVGGVATRTLIVEDGATLDGRCSVIGTKDPAPATRPGPAEPAVKPPAR